MSHKQNLLQRGFTIVELLIVVVVIAILASITIISYNGISYRAKESSLKSTLEQSGRKIESYKVTSSTGDYPTLYTDAGLIQPSGLTYTYTGGASYCLQAANGSIVYYISNTSLTPVAGSCPASAVAMQTVTTASCSTSRTLALDARDNRTYWIQKLADGKCWMLTNLAYDGGGTNTYSDVKTLQNGTADLSSSYTVAKYYVHSNANITTSPSSPSTSTDGGGTSPQYGNLYNWCAAMGAQTTTAACANAATPAINTAITVCPSGWRLPTGGTGSEYDALNTNSNAGATNTDAGLRTNWLAQRGGSWGDGSFANINVYGQYWSSTTPSAGYARQFYMGATTSYVPGSLEKNYGLAVRCIAN